MSDADPADIALLRRQRFDALCTSFRSDLFRFAFWLSGDRAVADDVVQDTLLRAWRSFDGLVSPASAKAWLMTIARREFYRGKLRRGVETIDLDALVSDDDALLADEESQEVIDMRTALARLDARYREPLVLQVLIGLSVKEIASELQLSTGAVLTRLMRARTKLRAALDAEANE
jgi:RNA polymerase sigma-70 factor (ECF subfamily)